MWLQNLYVDDRSRAEPLPESLRVERQPGVNHLAPMMLMSAVGLFGGRVGGGEPRTSLPQALQSSGEPEKIAENRLSKADQPPSAEMLRIVVRDVTTPAERHSGSYFARKPHATFGSGIAYGEADRSAGLPRSAMSVTLPR